jgi:cytochrome b6-f complex iron-sulfur subunit
LPDETTEKELPIPSSEETRRQFLTKLGLGACAVTGLGAVVSVTDFLEPKVLFEPPTKFRAGNIADFPEGMVRFNQEQRAYIIRGALGIFAMSAVCPHLGCITKPISGEAGIACPCHGSKFDQEGNVTHGPASHPLSWLEVKVDAAGDLTVDTSVVIPRGKALKV